MRRRASLNTSSLRSHLLNLGLCLIASCITFAGHVALAQTATQLATPTVIDISSSVSQSSVKRLGVNLGAQTYFDSGMILKNLVSRNPGFEGETWQSILHCKAVSSTSCTDDSYYASWTANFFAGAQMEVITGNGVGQTANITSNTAPDRSSNGVIVQFAGLGTPLAAGDYVVLRMNVPGNAQGGWWTSGWGNPIFATEFNDLSPNTPGKQAFRMSALSTAAGAALNSYFDSDSNHSFARLSGSWTLSFRAKGVGGSNLLNVSLNRITDSGNNNNFFSQNVTLSNSWQDYSYTISPQETGVKGIMSLGFFVSGAAALLDDVSFAPVETGTNPTAFRDEVVSTLKTLNPGILRYMDSGTNWGSSFDNMIAPAFARTRGGYSNYGTEADDIPIGLHDFLVLCQTLNVEPWYTMQAGMPVSDMQHLMDYLGGDTSTVYGQKRAALGQTQPWTTVFKKIHLEFGNEVWNTANPGATMTDPVAYAHRADTIYSAARASAAYDPDHFDFIVDGWAAVSWWNQQVLANGSKFDTIDAAPYLFYSFNDASSTEAVFGPMFAQPELYDSTQGGQMQTQAVVAATAGKRLSVYETNLSTYGGSVPQSAINSSIPSLGAGLVSVEHMMLMIRDLGITDQTMFSIAGFQQSFSNGGNSETTPLWGAVVDMGGDTNLRRPSFLAQQLANTAILPNMLATTQSGSNPTWDQPLSTNDNIKLDGAHYLQSFAFTDGTTKNVVLFNLSRTTALPVVFAGANAPIGDVTIQTLTSASVTDNNETSSNIVINSTTDTFTAGQTFSVPPYAMVVISSSRIVSGGNPTVSGLSVVCAQPSVAAGDSASCSASVAGSGPYSASVTWSSSIGAISPNGTFTAPAVTQATVATITAVSTEDPTKSGSTTINITAPATITAVVPSCAAASVTAGATDACSATVTGTGTFSSAVTWSASDGSITPAGLYTAPATVPASGPVTITATSTQDPTKSQSTTLTVVPASTITSITATCSPNAVTPGTQVFCKAAVTGSSTFSNSVIWTSSVGTVFTTGVFNVPPTASGTITITATSTQDPAKSASITVVVSPITSIAASCVPFRVAPGAQVTCIALVTGTGTYSTGVDWTTTSGAIGADGVLLVPTSASGAITVTATSQQDHTKSASAVISVISDTTITSIAPVCNPANVFAGAELVCHAKIAGTGTFNRAVLWTISSGDISPNGIVNVPLTDYGNLVVTATSQQDPSKFASTTVVIVPRVTITCTPASVEPGATVRCKGAVAGKYSVNSWYNWTASAGEVDPNGVFIVPADASGPITITATIKAGFVRSGSTTIQVTPSSDSLLTSCAPTAIYAGTQVICRAAGAGTTNSNVTWSASTGTIFTTGVYNVPSDATGSVTITAVSNLDPTKTASTTFTIAPTPAVTSLAITCSANTVTPGSQILCSANVQGTGSFSPGVNWSASTGNVFTTGVYNVPMDAAGPITITAVSFQDHTKSASMTLNVQGAGPGQ